MMKITPTHSLFLLIFLAGCQATQTTIPIERGTPSPMATVDPSKVSADVNLYPLEIKPASTTSDTASPKAAQTFDPFMEDFIVKVKSDLSQRMEIHTDAIRVRSVEAVEWQDGGLGCGKPGTEYLQVVTPGFLILLEENGNTYSYHTDTRNQIILCSEKLPILISPTP